MRIQDLPVYGPTDPFGDEEHTPEVIVRVDFLVSREQLVTALGIAWAEIAGDRDPESLTVVEVRHEVEAWLSVQAFLELDVQMERDRQRTWLPEQQRVMQVLAEAVDRAYPREAKGLGTTETPAMQAPRYGEGTVTLQTADHGSVEIPEPRWCTGHGWQPNPYLADVTHYSVPVKATAATGRHGLAEVLVARVSHAPYGERPEPHPVVSVQLDVQHEFPAEDIAQLARGLRVAATRLEAVAGEALRMREARS